MSKSQEPKRASTRRSRRTTRRHGQQDMSKTLVLPAHEPSAQAVAEDIGDLCVEVVGGPMDGWRSRAASPSLTIGRNADNDLALTMDPMVSGHHACIVREGDHFWLEDLGSRNGTYLGDLRLSERVLVGPGTTFTAGRTQVEFMPH